jgi:hypothetical protein
MYILKGLPGYLPGISPIIVHAAFVALALLLLFNPPIRSVPE